VIRFGASSIVFRSTKNPFVENLVSRNPDVLHLRFTTNRPPRSTEEKVRPCSEVSLAAHPSPLKHSPE